IARRGMPNYFGSQRFGTRLDSHLLGEALIKNDLERFADLMLGTPGELDKGKILQARQLYEHGHYDKACKLWPWPCTEQRKALQLLARNGGRKKKVAYLVSSDMKNFYVSAWQSYIFNQVLAARMPDIDLLLTGDMAWKHNNGSVFQVVDAAGEQPRCLAGEISATGPLPGMRMQPLSGPAGDIENAILTANGVDEQANLALKKYYARTGRRPLRVMPGNLHWQVNRDRRGDYLQLDFSLPAGSYATCLLREIMK
ncbi:MAG: tRNA pseudouridine(13) synthase TruD, partial [Sedimentisphaerales bacterium]|nr:tRNA pseudouridine(13) synthase TruD [Sedimentisphaerales bacterium]